MGWIIDQQAPEQPTGQSRPSGFYWASLFRLSSPPTPRRWGRTVAPPPPGRQRDGVPVDRAPVEPVATRFLRRRPGVVAPMMALVLGVLWTQAPWTQAAAVSVGFGVGFSFFLHEAWTSRHQTFSRRRIFGSLLATLLVVALGCGATGGLAGPLAPMLFAPTVITFAALGRSKESATILLLFSVFVAALAALPAPFPPLSPPSHRLLLAAATLTAGALLYLGVTSLTDAYATVSKASVQASEALADAAAERHQALEALGAKVAHELKNPLTALSGLLELMQEDQHTNPRRIEVMLGEVRRMEGLIRDYLSFNRPWAELNRAPTNLRALADQVTTLFEARAIQAGIRLRCEGPTIEAWIDAARIKEALINLVLNALEASPSGGQVVVQVTEFENRSALVVEDQGAGMSSETVARSTDAFFTTRVQGTGLGLTLARQIAEQHGGTLRIDSALGRGTQVYLVLP